MRVFFTTTSWRGSYFCLVPLAWALQAAGHEVRVACSPEQAEPIRHAGLVPVPAFEALDIMRMERMARYEQACAAPSAPAGPPVLHPTTGRPVGDLAEFDLATESPAFWEERRKIFGRNTDAAVCLVENWRPELVVHDLMSPEGALAARVAGVPAVYHPPGMFGSAEGGEEAGAELTPDDPGGACLRYGIEPWDRSQIEYAIDPSPAAVAPSFGSALRIPVRYVPYNGPGSMPLWTLEPSSRPRVCLIWGNSATAIFGARVPALRHAVDAVLALGAELLLTAGREQVAGLRPLPPTVRVLENFPLHMLLGGCDLVVHQGSVNGLMTAAAAGLPQLALGLTDDQLIIGERFARTGAGLVLPGLTADRDEIEETISGLLADPRFRAAARETAAGMAASPTPADLVPLLERLATTGSATAEHIPVKKAIRMSTPRTQPVQDEAL
jgi:UDP:flavonoid glycosyltransferase YjiC (YdhE family)